MGVKDKLKTLFRGRGPGGGNPSPPDPARAKEKSPPIEYDPAEMSGGIRGALMEQKATRLERGLYWETQIAMAYNSNKMEGGGLTYDQTRTLFETGTVGGTPVRADDVVEMRNHFKMFDYMLDTLDRPLDKELVQEFQAVLKAGTSQVVLGEDAVIGGWKTVPNAVGTLLETTPPPLVDESVGKLLDAYAASSAVGYREIANFHALFERIHPFQDGNGRVGRMLAFRECLANGLVPFIAPDDRRDEYMACLSAFEESPERLSGFFERMADAYVEGYAGLLPDREPSNAQVQNHPLERLRASR